jgi:hypothetical protein
LLAAVNFEKMARATIKLEFNAGDHIKDAFTEAIRIAKQLNCSAKFDFNGVTCLAHPEGLANKGVAMYNRQLKQDSKYRLAVA